MGTRTLVRVGLAAAAVLITVLLWPQEDPVPAKGDETAPTEAAEAPMVAAAKPTAATATTRRAEAQHGADFWLDSLSGQAETLIADENDPHAVVLRGQLTVRQRRWMHPAGVEIRLTRSFLDTVVPTDAGEQDDLAPAGDDPKAVTDAEGHFAFRFRPTSGELFFLIDHGGPWLDFQRVREIPRIGNELDLGEVLVDDRGGITGTVLDEFGQPARGATLRAVDDPLLGQNSELDELRSLRNQGAEQFRAEGTLAIGPIPNWVVRRDRFLPFPQTTTDGRGRFTLRGLRPGTHDVFVQSPQGNARTNDIQVAAHRDTEIGVVRLAGVVELSYRFIDESSRPYVGAGVALIPVASGFGSETVLTDVDGRMTGTVSGDFQIAFAYPGGGPWISLSSRPEKVEWLRIGRSRRRLPTGTIRVPQASPVTVILVDEHGRTIRNGRVRLFLQGRAFRPVDRKLPGGMQPRDDGNGNHVGHAPSQVVAVASAPGFAPAMDTVDPARDPIVTLIMLPLQRVTVRVQDVDRQPIAGATVRLQVHADNKHDFKGSRWTALANDRVLAGHTGPDGTLSIAVWDTQMSFVAEHPDYAPSPGPKLRPMAGEEIELLLRRTAILKGRLSFHHRPASAGFRLRARHRPPAGHELRESGWLDEHLAVIGEDGAFAFRGLCAGVWEVQPELPSVPGVGGPQHIERAWKKLSVSLDEGQEVWRNIEAEFEDLAAPQIAGTVAINGARVEGALVRIREIRPERSWRRRAPPRQLRLTTDAFGDFRFAGLLPNTDHEVRIDVTDHGRMQFLHREVVRTPRRGTDPATKVEIDSRCGVLQLHCLSEDRPFRNRMLRLQKIDAEGKDAATWRVLTNEEGACFIENLPAGEWTVTPVHGGSCEPAEFAIAPGAIVMVTVNVVER